MCAQQYSRLWAAVLGVNISLVTHASADTFYVTNALDSGPGSLRQAILDLNASAAGGYIKFAGTYSVTLASALPDIAKPVALTGLDSTVSGDGQFRVFRINVGASDAVSMSNLTVANGYVAGTAGSAGTTTGGGGGNLAAGAGIFVSSGVLSISDVAFTNNVALGGAGGAGGTGLNSATVGTGATGVTGAAGTAGAYGIGATGGHGGGAGGTGSAGGDLIANNNGEDGGNGGIGGSGGVGGIGGFGAGGGGGGAGGAGGVGGTASAGDRGSTISGGVGGTGGEGGDGGAGAGGANGGLSGAFGGIGGQGAAGHGGNGGRGGDGGDGAYVSEAHSYAMGGYGGDGGHGGANGLGVAGSPGAAGTAGGPGGGAEGWGGTGGNGGAGAASTYGHGGGGGGAALGGAIHVGPNGSLVVYDSNTDAGAAVGGVGGLGGGVASAGTAGQGAGSAFFLSGDTTFHYNAGTGTIAGSIADPASSGIVGLSAASVTKDGSQRLILTGHNTYRGATYINVGTLQVGDNVSSEAGLWGTNYVNVAAGAEFNVRPSASAVMGINGLVDVAGTAQLQGPGTVRFGGLALNGSVNLGSCVLEVGSNNQDTEFSGVMSDGGHGGQLTKIGNGTLTLSGANTFGNTTTVQKGTLRIGGANGSLASAWVNVEDTATLLIDSHAAYPIRYNASITSSVNSTGTISVNNASAGNAHYTLRGNTTGGASVMNFYNGATAGNALVSALTDPSSIGSKVHFWNTSSAGTASVGAEGDHSEVVFHDSSTAGAAQLYATGTGKISFMNNAVGGTANINLMHTGSVLELSGLAADHLTIGSLEGAGKAHLGARTLYVGNNNRSTLFSGVIDDAGTGSGSLIKFGDGLWTLTGNNAFGGAMKLAGGFVNFSTMANLGTGSLLHFDGGGLQWADGNTADISLRAVFVDAGGAKLDTGYNYVSLGHPVGNNGSGDLTKLGHGKLTLFAESTYHGDTIVAEGILALAPLGSIHQSPIITVDPGAMLDISGGSETYSLASGQILRNNGEVITNDRLLIGASGSTYYSTGSIGHLTMEAGSIYEPGDAHGTGNNVGTNHVYGPLTLRSNTSIFELVSPAEHDMTTIEGAGLLILNDQPMMQLVFPAGDSPLYGQYTLFQNNGAATYGGGLWLVDSYYGSVPTQLLEGIVYHASDYGPVANAFTIDYSAGTSGHDIAVFFVPEPMNLGWVVLACGGLARSRRRQTR